MANPFHKLHKEFMCQMYHLFDGIWICKRCSCGTRYVRDTAALWSWMYAQTQTRSRTCSYRQTEGIHGLNKNWWLFLCCHLSNIPGLFSTLSCSRQASREVNWKLTSIMVEFPGLRGWRKNQVGWNHWDLQSALKVGSHGCFLETWLIPACLCSFPLHLLCSFPLHLQN